MRRKLLCLALIPMLLAVAVGCNGLYTKGAMTAAVAANAAQAQPIIDQDKTGTLTPATASAYLIGPALVLKDYYAASTVNAFEFWFGKPTILANAEIYNALRACSLDAVENAHRVSTSPDADLKLRAVREAKNVIDIDLARRGLKPSL
jgi:hypothetical protein